MILTTAIAIVSIASIALNVYLFRKSHLKKVKIETKDEIIPIIAKLDKSGANLPDLSLELTDLAAENISSIDKFYESTNHLNEVLRNSVDQFTEIHDLGQKNITQVEDRIRELKDFIRSIAELNKRNQSINESIELMDDLSSQTNILSINASVEAARAGSEGKGFAVIAKSIRDLSAMSVSASNTIKETLENTHTESRTITSEASSSSEALEEILTNIQEVLKSLKEGIDFFQNNFHLVENISRSTHQLSSSVNSNLKAIRESSSMSIKMGIHLSDLKSKSRHASGDIKINFQDEFIKPAHVFHYNFTNTLPCILQLNKSYRKELVLPSSQDMTIKPQKVYQRLNEVASSLFGDFRELKKDDEKNIKPVDVLKLSVLFCNALSKKFGCYNLDKFTLLSYNDWKKDRLVTPSDVLYLVDQFSVILESSELFEQQNIA